MKAAGLIACVLVLCGSSAQAIDPLARVAEWAIQRTLPGAKVDIAATKVGGMSQLDIQGLVLRDRTSGDEVLRVENGRIGISLDGLRQGRIDELRLENPRITANPGVASLFAPKDPAATAGGGGWSIGRVVCDYGELHFETGRAAVRLKFAFDWKNLGDAEAAGEPLGLSAWDVQVFAEGFAAPFATIDVARIGVMPRDLATSRITSATVEGGRLTVGTALEHLLAAPPAAAQSPSKVWMLGSFELNGLAVTVQDKRPGVSSISFVVNSKLRDVSLAGTASALGEAEQTVEIADVEIVSPYDPLTKVFTLRSIFVRFTLGGLLRREIAGVKILNPTVYVGEDLFWYMDDAQKRFGGGPEKAEQPGWVIRQLDIAFGQLVLGSGGRKRYGLPLNFRASASDIALDNLATLQLRTELEIPAQQYAFESYQIIVNTRAGDLRFAYPPEQGRKNLVGKIFIESAQWRHFRAGDAWVSATFDREGINGDFGGRAYGGYLSGGFSFLFEEKSPWVGWLAGTRVDLRKLTDVLAPQNFRMTGPLDFRVQTDAFGASIERVKADLRSSVGGTMKITKLDDLLARVPADWPGLKKDSTRIALETLRDFTYTKLRGGLWFVRGLGRVDLRLQGPAGSRNFDIVLHGDTSQEGRWKK